jgi:hypothetical protein
VVALVVATGAVGAVGAVGVTVVIVVRAGVVPAPVEAVVDAAGAVAGDETGAVVRTVGVELPGAFTTRDEAP